MDIARITLVLRRLWELEAVTVGSVIFVAVGALDVCEGYDVGVEENDDVEEVRLLATSESLNDSELTILLDFDVADSLMPMADACVAGGICPARMKV